MEENSENDAQTAEAEAMLSKTGKENAICVEFDGEEDLSNCSDGHSDPPEPEGPRPFSGLESRPETVNEEDTEEEEMLGNYTQMEESHGTLRDSSGSNEIYDGSEIVRKRQPLYMNPYLMCIYRLARCFTNSPRPTGCTGH